MTMRICNDVETHDADRFALGPLIETRDGDFYTERAVRDTLLDPIPIGTICSAGCAWAGDLKPILDAHIANLAPLVTPFTIGNELQPDSPLPGQKTLERQRPLRAPPSEPALSLGRTWGTARDLVQRTAAGMAQQIKDRSIRDNDPGDHIDLTEVMDSLRDLHVASRDGLPGAVHAALVGVRDAVANVGRPRTQTQDRSHVGPKDFGRVVSPAEINKANREVRPITLGSQGGGGSVNPTTRGINEANRAARARKQAEAADVRGWDSPDGAYTAEAVRGDPKAAA